MNLFNRKKTTIIYLSFFILGVFFTACQKENINYTNTQLENTVNEIVYEKSIISFSELTKKLDRNPVFRSSQKTSSVLSGLNRGHNFITEIDSSKVVVFKNNNNNNFTYTFRVSTIDEKELSFSTIVLAEQNDSISTHLFRYFPSQEWINALNKNEKISFEGVVEALDLQGNLLAAIEIIDGVTSNRAITTCMFTATPIWIDCYGSECPCTDGNGTFGGYSYGISCSTTGGGGGGGGGTGGGGGGSGGGSGNNGDLPTDPDEWAAFMFDVNVFVEPEFKNNNKLFAIYTDMGRASAFDNYLQNFNEEFSVAHLRFGYNKNFSSSYPPAFWNAAAVTLLPQNYNIKIDFNGDNTLPDSKIDNQPRLIIALSFIHEIIHAETFRKLLSAAEEGEIPWTEAFIESLRNDYPGLADYYTRWWLNVPAGQPATSAQHQMMAQHYRTIIVDAISEFDNHQEPLYIYEALSWIGLKGTIAWNNLPPSQQTIINGIISDYYASH